MKMALNILDVCLDKQSEMMKLGNEREPELTGSLSN